MTRDVLVVLGTVAILASHTAPAAAGVRVYEEGDAYIEVGGRIQLQYLKTDGDIIESTDRVFFRRLRPYVQGTVTKNWDGKIQVDFGVSEDADELAIKDAWMRYTGWDKHTLYIGNSKTTFSREFLASSNRQQLVERTFVGSHNFGSPDRQLGFRLDGHTGSELFAYRLSLGAQHHDPDVRRIDFDTPVNNQTDWNEGAVVAARVDFMPAGPMAFDQADFRTPEIKYGFGLAAYTWTNDNDTNTYTDAVSGMSTSSTKADLDSANGLQASASLRGRGVSVDVDYGLISADTLDPAFTGGVYLDGTTELEHAAVEGGYMFPKMLEVVAGFESQDADNYQEAWTRTSLGLNYYINKHKLKVQFAYRLAESVFGETGNDQKLAFLQFQFVF